MAAPLLLKNGRNSEDSNETEKQILLEPHTHGSTLPKIKIMDTERLMKAYDFWFKIPKDKFEIIREISDLAFNSHAMVDDFQNDSVWPHKKGPTVQAVYGIPFTLNAANFAEVVALQKCVELHNPKAVAIFVAKSVQFYRAQISEAIWNTESAINEYEYRKKCSRKGGFWFQLPLQLMQIFTENQLNLTKLTQILGEFFQIYEDYLNVCATENPWGKDFLGEGSLNFPIVHALQNKSEDDEIFDLCRKKINNNEAKRKLFSLLEKSGSLQYTREILLQLRDEAEEEMKKFDDNPYMFQFIEDAICNMHNIH